MADANAIIEQARAYASVVTGRTDAFLSTVEALAASKVDVRNFPGETMYGNPEADVTAPSIPTFEVDELSDGDADLDRVINAISGIAIPDAGNININLPDDTTGNPPDIDVSGLPTMGGLPAIGTAPTLNEYTAPTAPADSSIPVPTVDTSFTMPTLATIDYPEFLEVPPDITSFPPVNTFDWSEVRYSSDLLELLQTGIADDIVSRGTGYVADLQRRLFELESERDTEVLEDSMNTIARKCAARGWNRPDGGVCTDTRRLFAEYNGKLLDKSRTIAKESADREQQQYQFAIQQGLACENMLIQYESAMAERSLRAAASTVELGVTVYNALLAGFKVQMERYQAIAAVYVSRIQAIESKIKIYTAQIEAEKTRSELEMNKIDLYKAQVEAATLLLNNYKTKVDAMSSLMNMDKLKLDLYRTQVDVFAQTVSAKKVEFDAYRAKVDGQLGAVQAYESKVRAYTAKLEAKRVEADVQMKNLDAKIAVVNARLSAAKAQSDAINGKLNIQVAQHNAQTQLASLYLKGPELQIRAQEANANIKVQLAKAQIEQYVRNYALAIEKVKFDLTQQMDLIKIKGGVLGTSGQVLSSYLHSALSAVNTMVGHIEQVKRT